MQTINLNGSLIQFIDKKKRHCSSKCQPRDIKIISGPDTPKVREAIAIDIRLGQGIAPIGVAKGLLHE